MKLMGSRVWRFCPHGHHFKRVPRNKRQNCSLHLFLFFLIDKVNSELLSLVLRYLPSLQTVAYASQPKIFLAVLVRLVFQHITF